LTKTFVATSRSWLAFIPVNPFSFCNFSPYVPLGLANKSSTNLLLVFSAFWVKGGVQAEGFTQTLIKLAGTLIGPSEDLWCFARAYNLFPSFLYVP
jgi:hypothetical protein